MKIHPRFHYPSPRIAAGAYPDDPRDPSPEEIRRACLLIQRTWRKGERHIRAHFRPPWVDLLIAALDSRSL
jgi:hypothetical protein